MNGTERREKIIDTLKNSKEPLSGTYLAKVYKVSRQVIVQDVAILRAEGNEIMATPQGYIMPDYKAHKSFKRIVACIHDSEGIGDELKTIIALGGRILDVIVEHPVYGEMRGMLMLTSLYDVDIFVKKLKETVGQPLLVLTGGVHLHTIEADSEKKLDMIEHRLREEGYLLNTDI